MAQQLADVIHLGAALGELATVQDGGTGDVGDAADDDAERLAGSVVVGRSHFRP